jgi:dTMP kinase
LLDNKNKEMLPQTEVYLYAASRSEFVRKVVAPALKEKKILITDRYVDSNLAYQGAGGIPIREIQKINSLAVEGILPDIVFLLDTSPEECQKRMSKRKGKDRIESKGEGYQVKISKNYHKLAEKNKNFVVIPQQKSITKTADLIFRKVKERAGI